MRKYLIFALIFLANFVHSKDLKISVSIKPLKSLVAQIADGVISEQNIHLLIKDGSPHGYSPKPSDIRSLDKADYILWVSDDLETFMPAISSKLPKAKTRVWQETTGVKLLKNRHGGLWTAQDHANQEDEDEHEHEHHAAKEHEHEHGHEHKHHASKEHEHEHEHGHNHDGHNHGEHNPHLWLSIENSRLILEAIAKDLSELDPENASKYQANLQTALKNLEALRAEIEQTLEKSKKSSYLVFHDAYPYFEAEFALEPRGVVRVDPEHEQGAKRIAELRAVIEQEKIVCLFTEPQFPAKLANKLAEGTNLKIASLDPVGADLSADKNMHTKLLQNLAKNLADCLGDK